MIYRRADWVLDRLSSDNVNAEYECLLGAPLAPGKRRSSYDSHPYVRSAKKRRISLASVDLSGEIQLPDEMILRTGTTVSTRVFFFRQSKYSCETFKQADRFISSRPCMETPLNTTPRSNRVAKAWGLANERVLKFSDASSSSPSFITPAPNGSIHNIFRRNAAELLQPTISEYSSVSASANIAKHMRLTLALDGPGMPTDPFSVPISWSSGNHIAIVCDDSVYYQNLNTRGVSRLYKSYRGDLHTIQWAGPFKSNLIAVGTKVGRVTLVDAVSKHATCLWPDYKSTSVGGMDWSDDILAVGRASGKISVFDSRQKGEAYGLYAGHDGHVHGVKWREDGIYLATGDEDGTVQVWDVRAGSKALGGAEKGRKMRHQGSVKVDESPPSLKCIDNVFLTRPWHGVLGNLTLSQPVAFFRKGRFGSGALFLHPLSQHLYIQST